MMRRHTDAVRDAMPVGVAIPVIAGLSASMWLMIWTMFGLV